MKRENVNTIGSNGWSQLRLFSVPPQGQDLSFDASESAFTVELLDESPGLPVSIRQITAVVAEPRNR